MWLELANTRTKVLRADDAEMKWLDAYLTFDDERAAAIARATGRGDGKARMLNRLNLTFPAGFTMLVARDARADGHVVQLSDARAFVVARDPAADLAWLRDYQRAAVDAAVAAERGILWLPTAAGKTEIAAGVMRALPCRWLFLAHRANLTIQAAERFALRSRESAAGVGLGEPEIVVEFRNDMDPAEVYACGNVMVATLQTLHAGIKRGAPAAVALMQLTQGIIVDEAHTLPADTFAGAVGALGNARFRLGLSGTPLARGDKRSSIAVGALGEVVYRIRAQELIDRGVIAQPTVRFVPVDQAGAVSAPTWQGVYGAGVVRSAVRNRAIADAARRAEKPCLVFVEQLDHGDHLRDAFAKGGAMGAVEFVSGRDSVDARRAAVKRLERGDADILVASRVFQEGVDIPALASVVMASGGKSTIAAIQKAGRALRLAPGKTTCEVWDIDDRGHRSLAKHARERRKAYAREGYRIIMESSVYAPRTKGHRGAK